MRTFVERLIYRKWFYGFLALVLWLDCWTDLIDLLDRRRFHDVVSLVASLTGALLVSLIFVDLHLHWPAPRR